MSIILATVLRVFRFQKLLHSPYIGCGKTANSDVTALNIIGKIFDDRFTPTAIRNAAANIFADVPFAKFIHHQKDNH